MDLDHLHRHIAISSLFKSVGPPGSGGGPFEEYPWQHMNMLHSSFKWHGKSYSCGITDQGKCRPCARVYLRGPDELLEECFNLVLGLLPHQDSNTDEVPSHAMCTLQDGRSIRWAAMTHDAVLSELALPSQVTWHKLSTQQKSEADCAQQLQWRCQMW